jgi:hypothetical protein
MTKTLVAAAMAVSCLGLAQKAAAQTATGVIRGVVWEEYYGDRVPDTEVTVVHEATGLERKTTSDDKGRFAFAGLPRGTYTILARRKGYRTDEVRHVPLAAGRVLVFHSVLDCGEGERFPDLVDWRERSKPPVPLLKKRNQASDERMKDSFRKHLRETFAGTEWFSVVEVVDLSYVGNAAVVDTHTTLGAEEQRTARDVCRGLYPTLGELQADKVYVAIWSGLNTVLTRCYVTFTSDDQHASDLEFY